MEKPMITKECVVPVYDSRFVKVYDLQYAPDKHYYDASRRSQDNLVAVKSKEEFKTMLPDAVSCVVILNCKEKEPLLCLSREFRYPAGQYLLSVPAGLIDADDQNEENPIFSTAIRELEEETGITFDKSIDTISIINPFLFSTPGMTDESNALVEIKLNRLTMPQTSQDGALGGECFDGFVFLTKEDARQLLATGRDEEGLFYSIFTWAALMHFVAFA